LFVRDIFKPVADIFGASSKRKKKFVIGPSRRFQGIKVRRILTKWIINARKNLVLNQDCMAIGLDENINPVSGTGRFFAIYRNVVTYRFLILNAAGSRERVQEQCPKPVGFPWVKEKREDVAARILLVRTACNL